MFFFFLKERPVVGQQCVESQCEIRGHMEHDGVPDIFRFAHVPSNETEPDDGGESFRVRQDGVGVHGDPGFHGQGTD